MKPVCGAFLGALVGVGVAVGGVIVATCAVALAQSEALNRARYGA